MAPVKFTDVPCFCGRPSDILGLCKKHYNTEYNRKWRKSHANFSRDNALRCRAGRLRRKYGITPEQKEAKWEGQKHKCAICSGEIFLWDYPNIAVVDHDHKTGKVRDLLCNQCNLGVGVLESDMRIKYQEYIDRHSK